MKHKSFSRKEFIKMSSMSGVGIAIGMPFIKSTNPVAAKRVPPSEPIIDIHQHTNYLGRTDDETMTHQRNMGITTTILLPSGHPVSYGSTYYGLGNGLQAEATANEACYNLAKELPDEFLFGANEVPDMPGAIEEIEKYLKLGAPIIGESKFGLDCDSPEMQKIYQLAQEYNVPVHQHWLFNMYNRGFERFHKMLEKYPKVNFIGHAQTWWANVDKDYKDQNNMYPMGKVTPGGLTDQLLSDYPNMFGDVAAPSGLNFFLRDEDHAQKFLDRHQDKLVFGSDCVDKVGHGPSCTGSMIISAIRRISPNKIIERKLLFENAKKLLRL